MDTDEAIRLLGEHDAERRLAGARFLAKRTRENARDAIRQALRREPDRWVRAALLEALESHREHDHEQGEIRSDAYEDAGNGDVLAEAEERVARQFLHELESIVGQIDLGARKEVAGFEESTTRRAIERLKSFVGGMTRLSKAAGVAQFEEFDLAAVLKGAAAEIEGSETDVEAVGPDPLLVLGDNDLIRLAVSNALRNAVEATAEGGESIVMNWGETERDTWVVVLDRGEGLPDGIGKAFDLGTSTKDRRQHFGMGLAVAGRAAHSLGGFAALRPREGGGTAFELRWPHVSGED